MGQHRDLNDPLLRGAARVIAMRYLDARERLQVRRTGRPTSTGRHDTAATAALVVAALLVLIALAVLVSEHTSSRNPPARSTATGPLVVTGTWYPPNAAHVRHADSISQLREVAPAVSTLCGMRPGLCPSPPGPRPPAWLTCPECTRFGATAPIPVVVLSR